MFNTNTHEITCKAVNETHQCFGYAAVATQVKLLRNTEIDTNLRIQDWRCNFKVQLETDHTEYNTNVLHEHSM